MAAELETRAINERNRAAKLEEENKTMQVEYEKLQAILMRGTSHCMPSLADLTFICHEPRTPPGAFMLCPQC